MFLARAENISKYDFTVGYPDGLEDGVKYGSYPRPHTYIVLALASADSFLGEVDFAQYKKLSEEQRAEIREAFLASQTQESVDEKMAFMDDKKGSFDCFESNKVQGYWNARAFYDPAWVGQTLSRDSAWTKKEKTFLKWAPTAVPFGYFLCGIGILKHWFPFVTYGVEALFVVPTPLAPHLLTLTLANTNTTLNTYSTLNTYTTLTFIEGRPPLLLPEVARAPRQGWVVYLVDGHHCGAHLSWLNPLFQHRLLVHPTLT